MMPSEPLLQPQILFSEAPVPAPQPWSAQAPQQGQAPAPALVPAAAPIQAIAQSGMVYTLLRNVMSSATL